ncbi:XdhC family protein [Chenggangzhangella methanolivorans]|uniref:XdhC family protein n=1 Tax=Chenggangzhangella methanolivorans TaxID=1437009 RepID=UPI00361B443A
MRLELLAALNAARAERRAAVVATALDGGAQRLILDSAGDPLEAAIEIAIRAGTSRLVDSPEGPVFLNVHRPPTRIVVVGAVHVSQALAPLAAALGHHVTVVDPRTAFATEARFSGVDLVADWPDRALPAVGLDAFTAFAALTHDPKIDDPGLVEALKANCFYVGALGSRKTHAKRVERLAALGVAREKINRIRAPIGLPIGASSPAEIALSILAEITQAMRLPEAP